MNHFFKPMAGGLVAGIVFLALSTGIVYGTELSSAEEDVRNTTAQVMAALREEGDKIKGDSQRLYQLIDDLILPHFDFEKMSRAVLGRHWRKASPAQQQAFMEQFQGLLVRTYGQALIDYRDQEVEVLHTNVETTEPVVVRSRIKQSGGPTIPISYRLYLQSDKWKVFDVTIDGVSLVTNYRASFNQEIRRNGLDGLIKRLVTKNSSKT